MTLTEALNTAIYNEKLASDNYRNLAELCRKAGNDGVAGFFDEQAKRETGHFNSLMKHKSRTPDDAGAAVGEVVKWITKEATAASETSPSVNIDDALQTVEEAEAAAERFYKEAGENAAGQDEELAALFAKLAEEEAHHGYLAKKIRAKLEVKGSIEPVDYEDLGFGTGG